MNSSLRLRLLTRADLAFADSIRALAGWNQTTDDWQRFLTIEPDGCFLAEWNGAPAGTATTTVYGPELAWIGMVLVHPDFRRRGIGRALLQRCIEYLRVRGVRCLKLDATPLGKKVYDDLGFKDEWTLTRWECAKCRPRPTVFDSRIRTWRNSDARGIDRLDSAVFGDPAGLGAAEPDCFGAGISARPVRRLRFDPRWLASALSRSGRGRIGRRRRAPGRSAGRPKHGANDLLGRARSERRGCEMRQGAWIHCATDADPDVSGPKFHARRPAETIRFGRSRDRMNPFDAIAVFG